MADQRSGDVLIKRTERNIAFMPLSQLGWPTPPTPTQRNLIDRIADEIEPPTCW
jgi:hypothetical protein